MCIACLAVLLTLASNALLGLNWYKVSAIHVILVWELVQSVIKIPRSVTSVIPELQRKTSKMVSASVKKKMVGIKIVLKGALVVNLMGETQFKGMSI